METLLFFCLFVKARQITTEIEALKAGMLVKRNKEKKKQKEKKREIQYNNITISQYCNITISQIYNAQSAMRFAPKSAKK